MEERRQCYMNHADGILLRLLSTSASYKEYSAIPWLNFAIHSVFMEVEILMQPASKVFKTFLQKECAS